MVMARFLGPFRRAALGGEAVAEAPETEKIRLLHASDVFEDLTGAEMERVGELTSMSECRRGDTIYSAGQSSETLFLLKRGRVQIYHLSAEGKKLVINTVEPGGLFGDMGLTGQSRLFDDYAEAVEVSTICAMKRGDIEAIILEFPSVGVRLVRILSSRLAELEQRLEESSLRGVTSRLAAALLRVQAQQRGTITITHQELADLVGAHRETVTRTLGDFRERGLIAVQRSRIEIIDFAELRALGGQPADLPSG
jgi:CRP/FNR family transcriptional regulator, cyclic AMP receptor protein